LAIPVPFLAQGIHAASEFVHANFLSRHLDVASLLNFRNPKHVLAVEIRKLMAEAGMRDDAAIETRWVWQWWNRVYCEFDRVNLMCDCPAS
jgi:hypothetical protein